MVPLLPAGVGIVETLTPLILHAYGVPFAAALAAVLSYRLLASVLPAVAGALALVGLRVGVTPVPDEDGARTRVLAGARDPPTLAAAPRPPAAIACSSRGGPVLDQAIDEPQRGARRLVAPHRHRVGRRLAGATGGRERVDHRREAGALRLQQRPGILAEHELEEQLAAHVA